MAGVTGKLSSVRARWFAGPVGTPVSLAQTPDTTYFQGLRTEISCPGKVGRQKASRCTSTVEARRQTRLAGLSVCDLRHS